MYLFNLNINLNIFFVKIKFFTTGYKYIIKKFYLLRFFLKNILYLNLINNFGIIKFNFNQFTIITYNK